MRPFLGIFFSFFLIGSCSAQANPLSVLGKVVTTSMDVRTKAEVTADAEIGAGASRRLLDDRQAEWAGVSVLVFAQHVVLAGAVKSAEVKKRVEEAVLRDKRIRSLKNELLVGDGGNFVRDTALEAQINAALTAAQGVASVNMRWSATGGRVVLMGVARSRQEAGVALQKIRALNGVRGVKSDLRVVAAAKK
ncbi:MAG TPA: BON domain-containing protein [Burkholderiales bacterium]|jgi:hyperosmotically inducible protein